MGAGQVDRKRSDDKGYLGFFFDTCKFTTRRPVSEVVGEQFYIGLRDVKSHTEDEDCSDTSHAGIDRDTGHRSERHLWHRWSRTETGRRMGSVQLYLHQLVL